MLIQLFTYINDSLADSWVQIQESVELNGVRACGLEAPKTSRRYEYIGTVIYQGNRLGQRSDINRVQWFFFGFGLNTLVTERVAVGREKEPFVQGTRTVNSCSESRQDKKVACGPAPRDKPPVFRVLLADRQLGSYGGFLPVLPSMPPFSWCPGGNISVQTAIPDDPSEITNPAHYNIEG